MIKKVVIPAAGKGTRMLHLTKNIPKHIIPVNGRPFIYHLLSNLKQAGFEEMILVVGYKKERIQDFVKEVEKEFPITIIDQFGTIGEERYGTACSIMAVRDSIGSEQFVTVYGDNLYSVNSLRGIIKDDEYNYIAGFSHCEPQRYGVLLHKDGFLERIIEKPSNLSNQEQLINTGLYKFTPEIFEAVNSISPSPRGEYELTDAVSLLANRRRVKLIEIKDYWLDFGCPEDITLVEKHLDNERL